MRPSLKIGICLALVTNHLRRARSKKFFADSHAILLQGRNSTCSVTRRSTLQSGVTPDQKEVFCMNEPIPKLDTQRNVPRGGVTPWEETHRVLETAELFWLSTVRADGRPHVTPLVAVWLDEAIHFCTGVTEQKAVSRIGFGDREHPF